MAINEDTCLHGGVCADINVHTMGTGQYADGIVTGIYVHIVGTGHYADGFCWFLCVCILSPYLGPYQRLARPDILALLTIW